jgi:signal transduction histidine kinase
LLVTAEEVSEMFCVRMQEKGLELMLRYAPGTPHRLIGDPGRIRQVLANLVSNAVKFTERGRVLLGIEAADQEDGHAALQIPVSDTGIGIASHALGQLFERFTQADASTTRRFGGSGLGLAISKRLVDLMGASFA